MHSKLKEAIDYADEKGLSLIYLRQPDGHYLKIEWHDKKGNKIYVKDKEDEICQVVEKVLTNTKRIRSSSKKPS